ncbi:site-specific integrase [Ureibacillus chungkukjangi]|uniref:tyrosine-type recombinase/integrase n=1 Tax=Ureibacillus chungkukjangi TaxID=1202712 RepID=UPI0038503DC2
MTKKLGLFDIEIDTKFLKKTQVGDTVPTSRAITDALEIISKQMHSSGYRERTINDYNKIVNDFQKTMDVVYLQELNVDTIYNWLQQMNVSNQTKLTRLKALKSFLGKCFNNGWYDKKFWMTVQIKVDKYVKKGAKESDIELLLSLLDLKTFIGLRDATAILTMYKTGIRINTLGKLQEKHIDFHEKSLKLDGSIMKNHKFLKLPIDDQLLQLLRVLIHYNNKIREHYKEQNDNVFISFKGTTLNTKSPNNAISKQLTKYSKNYGLQNISPHAIRRAYAKNLLKKGASVALISKALGHSDLAVTTQYLDLDVEEVAKDLRDYL